MMGVSTHTATGDQACIKAREDGEITHNSHRTAHYTADWLLNITGTSIMGSVTALLLSALAVAVTSAIYVDPSFHPKVAPFPTHHQAKVPYNLPKDPYAPIHLPNNIHLPKDPYAPIHLPNNIHLPKDPYAPIHLPNNIHLPHDLHQPKISHIPTSVHPHNPHFPIKNIHRGDDDHYEVDDYHPKRVHTTIHVNKGFHQPKYAPKKPVYKKVYKARSGYTKTSRFGLGGHFQKGNLGGGFRRQSNFGSGSRGKGGYFSSHGRSSFGKFSGGRSYRG